MPKPAFVLFLTVLLSTSAANAADHEVKAIGVKFEPLFVFVQPGDTVSFTNMPAHLVDSITSMMPEDGTVMKTEMGDNFTYTVTEKSGIHMYKCTPHWGARMGGGIVVGSPENADAILQQYMKAIEADGSLKPAKGLLKKLRKQMEKKGML